MRERYQAVMDQVAEAARRAGRRPDSVTVVGVSKHHPASAVRELNGLGLKDFSENYVQEVVAKRAELEDLSIRWHFSGQLQSNKARFVGGVFHLVHTAHTEKLARALHNAVQRRREAGGNTGDSKTVDPQPILLQVNVAREPQKSGVAEEGLAALAEAVEALDGLRLDGLMCMAPYGAPEAARPHFARLRELKEALETRLGRPLPELSMGMSGDFPQAVAEGATLVRIGTLLFGERPQKA